MKTGYKSLLAILNRWNLGRLPLCGVAVVSFAAGSLITARLTHLKQVKADSNRVFELDIYHAVPGKVPALESRFSDASKLLDKHDLNVVGYWVPSEDPAWNNTFIYLVSHSSREAAEKNWNSFHADPAFQKYRTSENTEKLIEKVDEIYMRPTNYSPIK
jgi:hypothetical protein